MQLYGRCCKARRRLDWAPSGVEGPPPDGEEGPDRHILMWENPTSSLPLRLHFNLKGALPISSIYYPSAMH